MGDEITEGLSDDLSTFTVIKEDDSLENISEEQNLDTDGNVISTEELPNFFDLDKVPEAQRELVKPIFEQMQTAFKAKMGEADGLKTQLDLVTDLVKKMNVAPSQSQVLKPSETVDKGAEQTGLKFKFQEDDYYKPVFEELATLISGIKGSVDGVNQKVVADSQATFQSNVKKFITDNKIQPAVLVKMDQIAESFGKDARGNYVLYNDLSRLHTLAKTELGIAVKPNTSNVNTNTKPHVKRQLETVTIKKGIADDKPANSMADAWNQAKEQLANQ
uniref:Uncharacterized protein n=1 Tax=viral metagenome TaxID=1070528 RepID=A0A6M3KYW5_9ZZZZ